MLQIHDPCEVYFGDLSVAEYVTVWTSHVRGYGVKVEDAQLPAGEHDITVYSMGQWIKFRSALTVVDGIQWMLPSDGAVWT